MRNPPRLGAEPPHPVAVGIIRTLPVHSQCPLFMPKLCLLPFYCEPSIKSIFVYDLCVINEKKTHQLCVSRYGSENAKLLMPNYKMSTTKIRELQYRPHNIGAHLPCNILGSCISKESFRSVLIKMKMQHI